MKKFNHYLLLLLSSAALLSCQKSAPENPQPEIPNRDHNLVSFQLDGKSYLFDHCYGHDIGTKPVNIQAYPSPIAGGKLAYYAAGSYWYGDPGMSSAFIRYIFGSQQQAEDFRIVFSKIFKDSELDADAPLLSLNDPRALIKPGPFGFSVDHEHANTQEGIFMEVHLKGVSGRLVSGIPGSPASTPAGPGGNLQDQSAFELTRLEVLKDGSYLIEAQFSLRLFDASGKAHQLTGGFMRLKASMKTGAPSVRN